MSKPDWADAKAREIMTDHDLRPLANTEREIAAALRAERGRTESAAERLCRAAQAVNIKSTQAEWSELRGATAWLEAALAAWKERAGAN